MTSDPGDRVLIDLGVSKVGYYFFMNLNLRFDFIVGDLSLTKIIELLIIKIVYLHAPVSKVTYSGAGTSGPRVENAIEFLNKRRVILSNTL